MTTPRPPSTAPIERLARCALVLGVLVVLPAPARAQDTTVRAQALFDEGEARLAAGRVDEACAAFADSNRLDPRAGTLIRLGQCREQQGRLASAWIAFHDALARVKDPRKRQVATAAVAALAPRLSYLIVVVPAQADVDVTVALDDQPVDAATRSAPIAVDGGEHVVSAAAPAHRAWRVTVAVPAERGHVEVRVPALAPVEAAPASRPPVTELEDSPAAALDVSAPAVPPRAHRPLGRRRTLALATVALGGAALALSGLLWSQAKDLEAQAYERCADPATACAGAPAANDLIDRARSRAVFTDVGLGVGVAALAGGAVLWFTGSSARASRVAVLPRVGSGDAAVELQVRF